ncbi:hypothetical protein TPHA_0D02330 [Tetrapisispora phaffii CBS 4417]|uniref:Tyrosyl-DNA phosphodiesterase 1 n=1 Tax=Tetrapisispora phaffii (strain ATCC 24235 / CBS 4417 / NBRC 1672 / NRRL Y-8282 / UCD 70-5) TaxID=1071381 RepID=G8BSP9_TETPH|nr:hypothetical protein TPHA_0D02330 [Tetrapisispora phaffii CBS 4417]CCE62870.1 hypothetical protein TPHA_0D02330 [Tetrapisispora phaffii CBS 4417]
MKEEKRSEVRRKVAEKWCNFGVKTKLQKTGVSTDEQSNRNYRQVIDLTNSSEDDTDIETSNMADNCEVITDSAELENEHSQFKLVESQLYEQNESNESNNSFTKSPYFIRMKDIFGDNRLKTSILFSFQFEMNFLLSQFNLDTIENIYVIAQKNTVVPPTLKKFNSVFDRLNIVEFYMPPFSCHHSKMVINIYEDKSCKLFIPSNNFTFYETNLPQQVCWEGPTLPYDINSKNQKISFKENLISYFQSYPSEVKIMNRTIIPMISNIDFSKLNNVEFLYSSPNDKDSGISKLLYLLEKNDLLGCSDDINKRTHFLCQSSTIGGSLSKTVPLNIFTHLMIPEFSGIQKSNKKLKTSQELIDIYREKRISPYIVYPTVEELRNSPSGWKCSNWFHFNYKNKAEYYEVLAKDFKLFYKQKDQLTSKYRKATPSHSKFYIRCTENDSKVPARFSKLDWCIFTSSNLSFNAWGKLSSKPRNYEVGILLCSNEGQQINCSSFSRKIDEHQGCSRLSDSNNTKNDGKKNINVMVPFTLPLEPYDIKYDTAFCIQKSYNLPDCFGEVNDPY